jgi:hypothetical protein
MLFCSKKSPSASKMRPKDEKSLKTSKNRPKRRKIAKNFGKLPKTTKNLSELRKIAQNVTKIGQAGHPESSAGSCFTFRAKLCKQTPDLTRGTTRRTKKRTFFH